MKVREVIELLEKIKDKEKKLFIYVREEEFSVNRIDEFHNFIAIETKGTE